MKKIELLINVRLPDGTTDYLPVVSHGEIKRFDSKKDAYDWAEFILYEKVILNEVATESLSLKEKQ